MRSSVVPQTIASETAQKANWKKNLAGTAAPENSIAGKADWADGAEEGALGAGEPAGAAEGEREPDGPVAERGDREVGDDLRHHRARVLHAGEADLQEQEAGLHEEDEDAGDEHPDGVDAAQGIVERGFHDRMLGARPAMSFARCTDLARRALYGRLGADRDHPRAQCTPPARAGPRRTGCAGRPRPPRRARARAATRRTAPAGRARRAARRRSRSRWRRAPRRRRPGAPRPRRARRRACRCRSGGGRWPRRRRGRRRPRTRSTWRSRPRGSRPPRRRP